MCGGFNVEVLENFCESEVRVDNIDDETRDASVEREPYQDETTVSGESNPYRDDESTVSDEGDTYRDQTNVSGEEDMNQDEIFVRDERDTYRDVTTTDPDQNELTVSKSILNTESENETTVPDTSVLNPESESSETETPKKKPLFSILDIGECFSDSSETQDISQYAPILFPRKGGTNDVTSSVSSSDTEELEDVYGYIAFHTNERHKANEKVDLLKIDPKTLPYRISNRVKKQSKFVTEDNIDKDILDENLKRLRGILLKKEKKAKHLVEEENNDCSNGIFYNGTAKNENSIPSVQLKPCSVVLKRLNISSKDISHNSVSKEISNIEKKITKQQMAMLKPCSIVIETSTVDTSYTGSKEVSRVQRKRPKKGIAKKLHFNVFASRPCTRSYRIHNTRRGAMRNKTKFS